MSKQVYTYSTGSTIAEQLRREVADEADTEIEYMDDDSLLYKINEFKRQIINTPFSGLRLDPQGRIQVEANGRGWDFMEEDKAFDFVVKTSSSTALTDGYTGNLTIAAGTSFTDEPGAFLLYDSNGNWDFITYLTKVSTHVLGTLGNVDKAWAAGYEVHKLYKLPSDFARAKCLMVNDDEMYEGKMTPQDHSHFAVYKGFLVMPRNFGIAAGTLTYFKQPTNISDLDEDLDIPTELDPALLNMLKAWAFGLDGEDPNLISQAYFAAADALNGALGYTVSSSNKRLKFARTPPRSPTSMGRMRTSRFDQENY